ncbi:ead/Ea22-like family protein [Glutamicibacter ardleyensis]|uniref:ead/Ea22-like family protein n=1 Tax=Glutamicibacter ardleyensis TaxID=225894 RepID=UPI003FD1DF1C
MKDLTNLRKIAEQATPGPWEAKQTPIHTPSGEGGDYYVSCPTGIDVASTVGSSYEQEEPDALHIATFDPPTVLALITRLEQAEQAVARVRVVALESQAEVAQMNMPNIRTLSGEILRALDGDTRG